MCCPIHQPFFMPTTLIKKIVLALFISHLLLSCAIPPKIRKSPQNTTTTAMSQLPTGVPVVNSLPMTQPVSVLPETASKPLEEVDNFGHTPPVVTLSEGMPSDFNLTEGDPVQLDFDQMDIRQVIEIIGDTLGITMVIDPTVAGKVTLRTSESKPLRKKDLWSLLQLLLYDAGISMEKVGSVYHLKKTGPSMLPGTIGLSTGELTGSDLPQVLQITPLRYISAESAIAALNPLVQPLGRIISLPTLNVIGIISSPNSLERINKLLEIVDADPFLHRGMRLFRLVNAKAVDIKADLDKILQAISGSAPAYNTIALERINGLLIIAPPASGFREVETWVNILDASSEESGEQVFIYRVRNLEAKDLAATLSSVFKSEKNEDEIIPKREEAPPTPPLPGTPPPPDQKPNEKIQFQQNAAVSADLQVSVVADESTNSLIIKATPRDYRHLMDTIYKLDIVPKEVMINAVIAEVKLTEETRFGIDWALLFDKVTTGVNFSIPSPGAGATMKNAPDAISSLNGLIFNFASGDLTALLNLVASESEVTILSRPSILVRNNEEASINVGTNEPIETSTSTSVQNPDYRTTDVQYKDTGIILKVTPRINEDGIINMKIEQTLSQRGTEDSRGRPSFEERKVMTSVVVKDSSAIVIGGLIEDRSNDSAQGIPLLRDLPFVGKYLFSTTNILDTRTELVLIIVPRIVDPTLDNRQFLVWFNQRMQMVARLLNEGDDILLQTIEVQSAPAVKNP